MTNWDAWVESHRGATELDLTEFEQGSSALLASLCLIAADHRGVRLINAPQGLHGLAELSGVTDWFDWETLND